MQLSLSPEEARELSELLAVALSDLRSEIRHTDSPSFRERLHERERRLLRLQEQLGAREGVSA